MLGYIIGCIVRSINRLRKAYESTGWPIRTGEISSARSENAVGGPVAEVIYPTRIKANTTAGHIEDHSSSAVQRRIMLSALNPVPTLQ
jgi:hypothetical protein